MNSGPEPGDDPRAEARQLLDMWENLSRQHVSMGAGCACGAGGVTVQLQDFEQDIVDYLLGQAERANQADVTAFITANALDSESGQRSIGCLLMALSSEEPVRDVAPEIADFLLKRLGNTLRSFARLHG